MRILNDPVLMLRLIVAVLLKGTITARLPQDTSSFAPELATSAALQAASLAACPGSRV